MTPDTTASMALAAIQVKGVPQISVEEALWTVVGDPRRGMTDRSSGRVAQSIGERQHVPDVLEQPQRSHDRRRPPAGAAHGAGRASRAPHPAGSDRAPRARAVLAVHVGLAAQGLRASVCRPRGGPRLLSLAELELLRDDLAERVEDARRSLSRPHLRGGEAPLPDRGDAAGAREAQVGARRQRGHRRAGLQALARRPRWGILGMLMNWWRVRISSGCPLARAGPRPAPGSLPARWASAAASVLQPTALARRRGHHARGARRRPPASGRASAKAARPRRRRSASAPGAPSMDDRPPPLWAPFPLTELLIARRHRADDLGLPLRRRGRRQQARSPRAWRSPRSAAWSSPSAST